LTGTDIGRFHVFVRWKGKPFSKIVSIHAVTYLCTKKLSMHRIYRVIEDARMSFFFSHNVPLIRSFLYLCKFKQVPIPRNNAKTSVSNLVSWKKVGVVIPWFLLWQELFSSAHESVKIIE